MRERARELEADGGVPHFPSCHYSLNPHIYSFDITGSHYRVACYFVDYNTKERRQEVTAWLGDSTELRPCEEVKTRVILEGRAFRDGLWVIWDVHGEKKFNLGLSSLMGHHNWILSALLIDCSPNPTLEFTLSPNIITIDYKSRGNWKERYGKCGGILFGKVDTWVPSICDGSHLKSFECHNLYNPFMKVEKYDWSHEITHDRKALQMYVEWSNIKG